MLSVFTVSPWRVPATVTCTSPSLSGLIAPLCISEAAFVFPAESRLYILPSEVTCSFLLLACCYQEVSTGKRGEPGHDRRALHRDEGTDFCLHDDSAKVEGRGDRMG